MLQRKPKRDGYLPLLDGPTANQLLPTTSTPVAQADAKQGKLRRGGSPATSTERRSKSAGTAARNIIASGQLHRQKDKFVPLPDSDTTSGVLLGEEKGVIPSIFEDLEPAGEVKGRITVYCIAETIDRKTLEPAIKALYPTPTLHSYPDVVHLNLPGEDHKMSGDVFFFDYGVVAVWGLSQLQEKHIIKQICSVCQREPLPMDEIEVDQFAFCLSNEQPHMQNDMITINRRQAADHQVKLAISHALAQSTKLSVYEERVVDLVTETKHLPEALAKHGNVSISRKQIAQLIGKVFLQRSAVNLLSTVLDTPEFFWSAPDHLQSLYERACEYMELETRVEVVNVRFQVLQEMLDMLRDHQNNFHTARLEWIIIWLIAVELVVGLFQLMGLFGIIGAEK